LVFHNRNSSSVHKRRRWAADGVQGLKPRWIGDALRGAEAPLFHGAAGGRGAARVHGPAGGRDGFRAVEAILAACGDRDGLWSYGLRSWRPQGLKPQFFSNVWGTTEVVPFPLDRWSWSFFSALIRSVYGGGGTQGLKPRVNWGGVRGAEAPLFHGAAGGRGAAGVHGAYIAGFCWGAGRWWRIRRNWFLRACVPRGLKPGVNWGGVRGAEAPLFHGAAGGRGAAGVHGAYIAGFCWGAGRWWRIRRNWFLRACVPRGLKPGVNWNGFRGAAGGRGAAGVHGPAGVGGAYIAGFCWPSGRWWRIRRNWFLRFQLFRGLKPGGIWDGLRGAEAPLFHGCVGGRDASRAVEAILAACGGRDGRPASQARRVRGRGASGGRDGLRACRLRSCGFLQRLKPIFSQSLMARLKSCPSRAIVGWGIAETET